LVVVARAIVVASPIAPPCAPANDALARACIGFTVAAPLVARLELVDAIDRVVTARVFVIVVAYMESTSESIDASSRCDVGARGWRRARKRGKTRAHVDITHTRGCFGRCVVWGVRRLCRYGFGYMVCVRTYGTYTVCVMPVCVFYVRTLCVYVRGGTRRTMSRFRDAGRCRRPGHR